MPKKTPSLGCVGVVPVVVSQARYMQALDEVAVALLEKMA